MVIDYNHLLRTDPQENINIPGNLLNQIINLFLREFIFSCPMINLFIFPLRIAFRLLPRICLSLQLALFSSVSWLLLILSLLARLCKTDCQFIMLEIASANWLDKTWVPLLFKWSFDAFRCLTVIAFPWFMK